MRAGFVLAIVLLTLCEVGSVRGGHHGHKHEHKQKHHDLNTTEEEASLFDEESEQHLRGDGEKKVKKSMDVTHVSREKAQRAFIIMHVENEGFLLMKAYKAVKGGEHMQLPGGRIDPPDFKEAGVTTHRRKLKLDDLVEVGRLAASREVLEETKIDLRHQTERLQFLPEVSRAVIRRRIEEGKSDPGFIEKTDLPRKLYYFLQLTENEWRPDLIELSDEHIGYELEADLKAAAKAAQKHSGGDSARALEAFEQEMEVYLITE